MTAAPGRDSIGDQSGNYSVLAGVADAGSRFRRAVFSGVRATVGQVDRPQAALPHDEVAYVAGRGEKAEHLPR